MWHWFKNQKKSMFRFRGGVTAPYDLEYISGKWGHIKLDDDAINQELFDHYQKEASELEKEIDLIPRDEEGENRKKLKDKLGVLLGKQADLIQHWKLLAIALTSRRLGMRSKLVIGRWMRRRRWTSLTSVTMRPCP